LTRWTADWEGAARHYRDAVKFYKLTTDYGGTVLALRESAIAHKEIDSIHTAAADLEAAAQIVKEHGGNASNLPDPQLASQLYKESAALYKAHGSSYDKAAATLVKAAEAIGDVDVNAGVELMREACAVFEEENRFMFHDAVFKKAICFCVARGKFGSARSLLKRQIKLQQQALNPFESDMYKNCLAIIVLWLHTGDGEKAGQAIQEYEGLVRFTRSEEYQVANELICAWEDNDVEKWTAALKKQTFKYLLNPIAVLARKLKMPEGAGQGAGLPEPAPISAEEINEAREAMANASIGESEGGGAAAAASSAAAAASSSSSAAAKKPAARKHVEDEDEKDDEEDEGEIDLR